MEIPYFLLFLLFFSFFFSLFVDFVHVVINGWFKISSIYNVNFACLYCPVDNIHTYYLIILDNFMLVCETVLFCMNVFFLFVLFINDCSLNAI